ncbi:hypothetical protein [Microvirga guangxiensis]|uniref:6-phosphofructokinase 2 n=1 Tax=Microvirga guangxiensis TaxID=549386 RepID=A0A1G5K9L6_9HYPH|nr:hypothetical protein [Microvirga guangxiensis]SCY97343.1 6-phosphofructokinase 2 [Microvirga guangxiensis]
MKPVVTLTLNPSIDGSSEAEAVRPIRKVRTSNERYEPVLTIHSAAYNTFNVI